MEKQTFNDMKINCVVVTHNRLSLLKENLAALKKQTIRINKIFVINNSSSDGTTEYLDSLQEKDSQFHIIHSKENKGGAWGFYEGIKQGTLSGCDYIWIMDDDTIPTSNALEELVKGFQLTNNVGFVCSKVVWTDGREHKMNVPGFIKDSYNKPIVYHNTQTKGLLCQSCSFVSVIFSTQVIYEVGLPIKEFFIWLDDMEYTNRIHNHNYKGLYIEKSVVVHKTTVNYGPQIQNAPVEMAWKFYYHARNTAYMNRFRKKNIFSYYLSLLNKYRVYLHRINKRNDSKENKEKFKTAVKKGCKDGIRFYPHIEYLPPRQ